MLIAQFCQAFHVTPDQALKTPARAFFALHTRAARIKRNMNAEMLAELVDVAFTPACKVEYGTKLKEVYLSRLEEKLVSDDTPVEGLDTSDPVAQAVAASMLTQLRRSTGHG